MHNSVAVIQMEDIKIVTLKSVNLNAIHEVKRAEWELSTPVTKPLRITQHKHGDIP